MATTGALLSLQDSAACSAVILQYKTWGVWVCVTLQTRITGLAQSLWTRLCFLVRGINCSVIKQKEICWKCSRGYALSHLPGDTGDATNQVEITSDLLGALFFTFFVVSPVWQLGHHAQGGGQPVLNHPDCFKPTRAWKQSLCKPTSVGVEHQLFTAAWRWLGS